MENEVKSIKAGSFFTGQLSAIKIRPNGGLNTLEDLGILQMSRLRRVWDFLRKGGIPIPGGMMVTTAGATFMASDWELDTLNISNYNFHDSGTGVTAAAIGDTDLGTPAGPTTRATGTKSKPSAIIIRSVGTINYTSTLNISEWGLFSTASRATVELWDRRVFTAVPVINGESIQFTYDLTINAGG